MGLLGLTVLLGLLPLVVVARRLEGRGPILQRALRVGIQRRRRGSDERGARRVHDVRGVPFVVRRFDTLDAGTGLPTPVGRVLAATRLAGLPQTINLLLGQLSLVGPRAASPRFLDQLYRECPESSVRLVQCRPGLAGPAQLHGNERESFHTQLVEKAYLESAYAARLGRAGVLGMLGTDLAHLCGRLLRRRAWTARCTLRLEAPVRFDEVQLSADALIASLEPGLDGLEHREDDEGAVLAWGCRALLQPRWPRPHGRLLEQLAGEPRLASPELLSLRLPLAARRRVGCDRLGFELGGGAAGLLSLCDVLDRFWSALRPRLPDAADVARLHAIVCEALVRLADGSEAARVRLVGRVEVDESGLQLEFERLPAETEAGRRPLQRLLSMRLPDARRGV